MKGSFVLLSSLLSIAASQGPDPEHHRITFNRGVAAPVESRQDLEIKDEARELETGISAKEGSGMSRELESGMYAKEGSGKSRELESGISAIEGSGKSRELESGISAKEGSGKSRELESGISAKEESGKAILRIEVPE